MITKLSHATLVVRDQEKAYDVYVNKLGFQIKTDMKMDNGFRWLTVAPPNQKEVEMILLEPRSMFDASFAENLKR